MNLSTVGIIFRKELLDTLRDRKTLFFMVALPLLLIPGLITVMVRLAASEERKTRERRLVVQAEPAEQTRFTDFLRARLPHYRAQFDMLLDFYGPTLSEPARAIATDLGMTPSDVVFSASIDPRIQAHPRAEELRTAAASTHNEARSKARKLLAEGDESGGGTGLPQLPGSGPDFEKLKSLQALMELASPLTTFDYVSAAQVAERPAQRSAVPVGTLPDGVRSSPFRSAAAIAISERRIHAALRVPSTLDAELAQRDDTVPVEVVYESTFELSEEAERRISTAMAIARDATVRERLERETLPGSFVTPVRVDRQNAAPPAKEVTKVIASALPYILILMCFLGGFYPATDLGAGEKERLTLETLLASPASRLEITLGKFGVVFLSAVIASLFATGSLAYSFTSGMVSSELSAVLKLDLDPKTTMLCLALVVPLAAIFAAVMLAMSIYAKSQKEAQSLMMPLQFLIIVPAAVSMIPTIELDPKFACVPVMNVALGVRTILTAGGAALPWLEIAITFVSTCLVAALALLWCAHRFTQEKVIFRS